MKNVILATILGLFLISVLKAQTTVSVSQLSEPSVIVGVVWARPVMEVTIDDGNEIYRTTKITLVKSDKREEEQYFHILSNVINQVTKQGYKLVSSNTITMSYVATSYIFQKE